MKEAFITEAELIHIIPIDIRLSWSLNLIKNVKGL